MPVWEHLVCSIRIFILTCRSSRRIFQVTKKELRKIIDEELKPYRDNISIIDRAIRWVRLIADLAIITVSTLVVTIVFYSQMYPLKWRARVDGLIDDLAQSLKYKTFGGWHEPSNKY